MTKKLIIAMIMLLPLSACQQNEAVFDYSQSVMGTMLTVTAGENDELAAKAAIAEVQSVDELMSLFKPQSQLSQLNNNGFAGAIVVDQELFDVIAVALDYAAETGGAFDPTAGELVDLWGFYRKEHFRIPTPEQIAEKLAITGYQLVEIDRENRSVFYQIAGIEIDLGGIAKGYSVDLALAKLQELGVASALVNLGGNIRVLGLPAGRDAWALGVRDPRDKEKVLGKLMLGQKFANYALASSGQYEQYFEFEGQRYGHIIDPRSGYPAAGVLGTTIIAPDAITADALSTAVFVLGLTAGQELLEAHTGCFGIITTEDGVYVSDGIKDIFETEKR
jgi:thiamine biosynthesis lipoprotein